MKLNALRCTLALLASLIAPAHAGLLDREVSFSEAEIQAELDKRGPQEKRYGQLLTVGLKQAPRIRLGMIAGRVTLSTRIDLALLGQPAIPVDVDGTAGIRYDEAGKAFYLENPVAESVSAPTLSRDAEPVARQAITQLMTTYFKGKPIYVLREDGSAQERAARWLLRAIRIEPGRVVATLSPV